MGNQRIDTGDTRALCCGIGGSSCGSSSITSSSSSSSILQMDGLLQSLCGLQAGNKAAVPSSVPSAPSSEDVNKPCGSKTAHADLPSPPCPADSPSSASQAAADLRSGELQAPPTDTVWGMEIGRLELVLSELEDLHAKSAELLRPA